MVRGTSSTTNKNNNNNNNKKKNNNNSANDDGKFLPFPRMLTPGSLIKYAFLDDCQAVIWYSGVVGIGVKEHLFQDVLFDDGEQMYVQLDAESKNIYWKEIRKQSETKERKKFDAIVRVLNSVALNKLNFELSVFIKQKQSSPSSLLLVHQTTRGPTPTPDDTHSKVINNRTTTSAIQNMSQDHQSKENNKDKQRSGNDDNEASTSSSSSETLCDVLQISSSRDLESDEHSSLLNKNSGSSSRFHSAKKQKTSRSTDEVVVARKQPKSIEILKLQNGEYYAISSDDVSELFEVDDSKNTQSETEPLDSLSTRPKWLSFIQEYYMTCSMILYRRSHQTEEEEAADDQNINSLQSESNYLLPLKTNLSFIINRIPARYRRWAHILRDVQHAQSVDDIYIILKRVLFSAKPSISLPPKPQPPPPPPPSSSSSSSSHSFQTIPHISQEDSMLTNKSQVKELINSNDKLSHDGFIESKEKEIQNNNDQKEIKNNIKEKNINKKSKKMNKKEEIKSFENEFNRYQLHSEEDRQIRRFLEDSQLLSYHKNEQQGANQSAEPLHPNHYESRYPNIDNNYHSHLLLKHLSDQRPFSSHSVSSQLEQQSLERQLQTSECYYQQQSYQPYYSHQNPNHQNPNYQNSSNPTPQQYEGVFSFSMPQQQHQQNKRKVSCDNRFIRNEVSHYTDRSNPPYSSSQNTMSLYQPETDDMYRYSDHSLTHPHYQEQDQHYQQHREYSYQQHYHQQQQQQPHHF
mmetsp:Transcript_1071/g.1370  ORF Transcript_1071/g.1370 Transcript_1071/m.1370 type:complete len:745 (+) Transcript_1071:57-2291(+)